MTTELKHKIKEQIAFGIAPAEVAAYHRMPLKQLMREYGDIVARAAIDLDVEVARTFYALAVGQETEGNAQACINWLKSRGQWDKLKDRSELPTEDKTISKVVIETLSHDTDVDALGAKGDVDDDND